MTNQDIGKPYAAGGIIGGKLEPQCKLGPVTEKLNNLERLLSDIALKASRAVTCIHGPQNESAGSDKDRGAGITGRLDDMIETASRVSAALTQVEEL